MTLLQLQLNTVEARALPQYTGDVKQYVFEMATEYGVDTELADYVVKHESHYNPDAVGDLQPMKDGIPAYARGAWQITKKYHSEISDECAFDVVCATKWAMPVLKDKALCMREFTTCRNFYKAQTP